MLLDVILSVNAGGHRCRVSTADFYGQAQMETSCGYTGTGKPQAKRRFY